MMTRSNFSYDYLPDAASAEQLARLDLSSWRLAFNGAEPVSLATVESFAWELAPCGVGPGVMYAVYGLAEATFAVTFPAVGTPPKLVSVRRDELARGEVIQPVPGDCAGARRLFCVGRPVLGMGVRIGESCET